MDYFFKIINNQLQLLIHYALLIIVIENYIIYYINIKGQL